MKQAVPVLRAELNRVNFENIPIPGEIVSGGNYRTKLQMM